MYDFVVDYSKEERQTVLALRTTLKNKVGGNPYSPSELDALKDLTLDVTRQLIDEPQINADARETALSTNPTNRTRQTSISDPANVETLPSFLWDGRTVIYQRKSGTDPAEVWAMDWDGTNKRVLIQFGLSDPQPHVQGDYLAYLRLNEAGNNNIILFHLPTLTEAFVTNTENIQYHTPRLSPDGTKVAFASNEFGKLQIFTINRDGTGKFRVVNRDSVDEAPSWMWNGSRIAFHGPGVGGTTTQIWSVKPDGTDLVRVTNNAFNDSHPSYSLNNKRIAFSSDRYGTTREIVTMEVAGTDVVKLTDNTVNDHTPQYSPDGVMIAWERDSQIYIAPAEGVPVYPEYRHEFYMNWARDYHMAWSYQHDANTREMASVTPVILEAVRRGFKDHPYKEHDPTIVDRSLLRHGYRDLRPDEVPPPDVVGRYAPPPGA